MTKTEKKECVQSSPKSECDLLKQVVQPEEFARSWGECNEGSVVPEGVLRLILKKFQ